MSTGKGLSRKQSLPDSQLVTELASKTQQERCSFNGGARTIAFSGHFRPKSSPQNMNLNREPKVHIIWGFMTNHLSSVDPYKIHGQIFLSNLKRAGKERPARRTPRCGRRCTTQRGVGTWRLAKQTRSIFLGDLQPSGSFAF